MLCTKGERRPQAPTSRPISRSRGRIDLGVGRGESRCCNQYVSQCEFRILHLADLQLVPGTGPMNTQSIDSQPWLSYIEKTENSVTRAFGGIMLDTQPILAIDLIVNLGRRSGR